MRSGGRTWAALTALACCLAACGGPTAVLRTSPPGSTPRPPAAPPPSELPVETAAPPVETAAPTVETAAPTVETTAPPVESLEFFHPIRRVVVVGDSLLFDGRSRSDGRANEIVPTIARHVVETPGLEAIRVRNAALPGLAVKHAINPNIDQRLDTLADYVPVLLADLVRPGDLVVIAVSNIDVIVMMDDDEALPSQELLTDVVDELRRWRDLFVAVGVPVAFIPPFGVNDEMYDDLKNAFVDEPRRYVLSARLQALGDALRESDLFMLVDGFPGLDADGDGSAERSFFVDYDTRVDGWPDDGIHPNLAGETLYGDTVGPALAALLIDAV